MKDKIHLYGNIMPPKGKDKYFFTLRLNENGDGISFDNTIKGHRILKQINAGKINTAEKKIREEWDTYYFIDGKFEELIHEKWLDEGTDDIINGTIYRQVWEIKTPAKIDEILISLNNLLWKNKENLESKIVIEKTKEVGLQLNKFVENLQQYKKNNSMRNAA
ncbi:hypothetical protein KAT36_04720 [Candidatus Pacearchaeota archaeon]|nr:hypothetical protein [Candidatus Pacearchaeota archaeon]